MERERVLIEKFSISRLNEKKALEIRLPMNAKRLNGFWVSVRFPNSHNNNVTPPHSGILTHYPNYVIGDLRLFTLGKERNFFSFQLSAEDANIGYGDVSQLAFPSKPWSHGLQPDFIPLDIKVNSRLLKGYYRDRMEEFIGFSQYDVQIYIWYNFSEQQTPDCKEQTH